MKKILYIVSFIFAVNAVAQGPFQKGNDLYRKGKYEEAAASYESILKSKKESADVYFNLGNAYYKLGRVAPAIYNYEKALLLRPGDKDIAVNLSYAQKMAIDDIKATPRAGFSKMLYGLTGAYHYDTWAWVAVAFSAVSLLLFTGYYFAGTALLKRVFFIGMCLGLVVIALSLLSAMFVKGESARERPAIVFDEVVSVKSEPSETSEDAFILHEGTKVLVQESVDGWRKVSLADDSGGWIPATAIREVK